MSDVGVQSAPGSHLKCRKCGQACNVEVCSACASAPSKSGSFKHGELVALVKWWHDGDTVPEGWTPMGPFNRGEAIENQRLLAALEKYGHHTHPNCHDLTLNDDGSFGPRNGCLCGFDAARGAAETGLNDAKG